MQVIYRITSIPSSNQAPVLQEDKNKLNKLCLKSFLTAFVDIKPKITFLADNVNDYSFTDLIPKVWEYEVRKSMSGINQTMLDSYELASNMATNVLFQECDYLYYPSRIGQLLDDAISHFGLVSPYDHPDFYERYDIHPQVTEMEIFNNRHFRKSHRNTMTWGCKSDMIRENRELLDSEGYLDGPVWDGLRNKGWQLWTPIPSFATHMVESALAHSIDWRKIWTALM